MTREEVMQLVAGQGMDELVGSRVMGYRYSVVYNTLMGRSSGEPWSPSFNLVQAWRVVQRMQDLGYEVSMANRKDKKGRYRWGVDFYMMIDEAALDSCYSADADTIELAICRAALLAVTGGQ